MSILTDFITNVKKIEKLSLEIILCGVVLGLGLILLGYISNFLITGSKNTLMAIECAQGAFNIAPLIIVEGFICGIISDMAIKDKKAKSE